MVDPLLTELNVPKPELIAENHDMPKKYHDQLKKVFKKYYHTAIRRWLMIISLLSLVYLIVDDIFMYRPSKLSMIMIATGVSLITISMLVYPIVRLHKIKQKHYKWYIGNFTMSRNKCIYIDNRQSIPTDKNDYQNANKNDIYLLVWIKNRKYAVNPHVSDVSELVA